MDNQEPEILSEEQKPQESSVFKDGQATTEVPTDGVYEIHQNPGKLVVTYKDGKKNGETVIYDEDNKIRNRMMYQDDQLHGQMIIYQEGSEAVDMTMVYKNNILDGPMKGFYPSEEKRFEGTYVKGKLEGDFIFYDEFSDICQKTTYKGGLRDGVSATYFPKSQGGGACQVSHYEKGLLVQNQDMFYSTGELLQRTPYQKGKATAYPSILNKDGKALINPANKNRGE